MEKRIGLVFVGGGGKGAYQIGVWKALCETGLDKQVKAVSGTSVGGLNAALFAQGSLTKAIDVWENIAFRSVIKMQVPSNGFCSNENLANLIRECIDLSWRDVKTGIKCYITAASYTNDIDTIICSDMNSQNNDISKAKPYYFELTNSKLNIENRLKLLLATSAIPHIFPKQKTRKREYADGGIADNVPIKPLHDEENCDLIIVVHLNETYRSHDIIVDRNRFKDSIVIEIWPQHSQGGLYGTFDFNAKHAKRRISEGYNENIAYFKLLADGIIKNSIPDSITFSNALHEMDKNVEFFNEKYKDKMLPHTLQFIGLMLMDINSNLNNIKSELQQNKYDIELNRYMITCNKKQTLDNLPYTSLSFGDRLLCIVIDLYKITGCDYVPDDIEIETILEKTELPQKICKYEFYLSITKEMLSYFSEESSLRIIDGISEYTKMLYKKHKDEFDISLNNEDVVRTSTIVLEIINDIQKIKLYQDRELNMDERVDKSIFTEDTVYANNKIYELYNQYGSCNITRKSHIISPECLDYINRKCIQFKKDYSFNAGDNHGVLNGDKIQKLLKLNNHCFLSHLDSLHENKRGFVIDSDGIHALIQKDSEIRIDTSFIDLADISDFINYKSRNVIDKAKLRTRIKGKKKDSNNYIDILPKKYIHSKDIIKLLEDIRNACWVDLFL